MRHMNRARHILALTILIFPISAPPAVGQESSSGSLPRFEVASIKPVDPAPSVMHVTGTEVYPGGRIHIESLSLETLIAMAFDLHYRQFSNADDWMSQVQFDIEAEPPAGMQHNFDTRHTWYTIEDPILRQMLQALLIDRFHLKYHIEKRTGDVYILVRNGKTLRLRPSKESGASDKTNFSDIGHAGSDWVLSNTSMVQLAKFVGNYYMHCPVIDETGLTGAFDFRYTEVQTSSDEPSSYLLTSILPFIDAMGLKLKPAKGLVETFVIDHAEKPSPN